MTLRIYKMPSKTLKDIRAVESKLLCAGWPKSDLDLLPLAIAGVVTLKKERAAANRKRAAIRRALRKRAAAELIAAGLIVDEAG